jgi:hypothetical protein
VTPLPRPHPSHLPKSKTIRLYCPKSAQTFIFFLLFTLLSVHLVSPVLIPSHPSHPGQKAPDLFNFTTVMIVSRESLLPPSFFFLPTFGS